MKRTVLSAVVLLCASLVFADMIKTTPYYTNIYSKKGRTAYAVGNEAEVRVDYDGFSIGNTLSFGKLFSNFNEVKGNADLIGASGYVETEYAKVNAFVQTGTMDSLNLKIKDYGADLNNMHFFLYGVSPEVSYHNLKLFSSFKGFMAGTSFSNLAFFSGAPTVNGLHTWSVGFQAGPASLEYFSSSGSFSINNDCDVHAVKAQATVQGMKEKCSFQFKHFNMDVTAGFFACNIAFAGDLNNMDVLYAFAFNEANVKGSLSTQGMMVGFDFDVPFKHSNLKIDPYVVALLGTEGSVDAQWNFSGFLSSLMGSYSKGQGNYWAKSKFASLILMNVSYEYKLGNFRLGTSRLIPLPLIGKIETQSGILKTNFSFKELIKKNFVPLLFAGISVYVTYSR